MLSNYRAAGAGAAVALPFLPAVACPARAAFPAWILARLSALVSKAVVVAAFALITVISHLFWLVSLFV